VALSVRSPCPAVSRHLALWSPDFPHALTFNARDRPAHSIDYSSTLRKQAKYREREEALWVCAKRLGAN